MRNQVKIGLPQNARWFPSPSAITSGMPVLIGTMAAVAMDDFDASTGGTNYMLDGDYNLTVIGQSTQSPNSVQALPVGAELYATGTLDVPTNITYNLTIDGTRGNTPFGNLMAPTAGVAAGVTQTTAVVRLKTGGSPGPYAP